MYDDLPLVEFEYPDSETSKMKIRYVRVISRNRDYLTGYELSSALDALMNASGKFKKYSTSRIPRNGIHLCLFEAPART